MAESEEELKSLMMKVKEESEKAGLISLTCMCPMNYQGNLSKTQVQPGQPHCPPQPGLGDWGDFPTHLTEVGTEQLKPWAPDQPGLGLHPGWAVW